MNPKDDKNNKNDTDEQNVIEDAKEASEAEPEAEDIVPEDEEQDPRAAIKKLREKLKKCTEEKQLYLDGWQRAKADLVNARKRDEEDRKQFIKFANESMVADMIPVLDSFEMAMANKEAWEKADKNWRMGVEYIYSQLKKVLSENGLKEMNPVNEKFDHSHHEAVGYEPVDDEKLDHVIIDVIQKGYSLNGKILKPPKVKVGEFRK
jgi:molecular chaperone GrpE